MSSSSQNLFPTIGIRPWQTISKPTSEPSSGLGALNTFARESENNSNSAKLACVTTSFLPNCRIRPEGEMDQVWMDVTVVSLFSNPAALRYRSADRLFRIRSAFRSIDTNFPVASTVKSSHCSTTTAALPSPKWFRSTRLAAASQSGAESARLMAPGCAQSSRIAPSRHEHAATANLLPTKNHDFLIVFSNIIKELPGAQILHIGLEQRLF